MIQFSPNDSFLVLLPTDYDVLQMVRGNTQQIYHLDLLNQFEVVSAALLLLVTPAICVFKIIQTHSNPKWLPFRYYLNRVA